MFYIFLLYFYFGQVFTHGGHGDRPKLVYVIMDNINSTVNEMFTNSKLFQNFKLKRLINLHRLNSVEQSELIARCSNCTPIWLINQQNKFESAVISLPGEMTFKNIWPTYSLCDGSSTVGLKLRLARLQDWLRLEHVTLGILYVPDFNVNKLSASEIRRSITDLHLLFQDDHLNFIVIKIHNASKNTEPNIELMVAGSRFNMSSQIETIQGSNVIPIICNVLNLKLRHSEDCNITETAADIVLRDDHGVPTSSVFTGVFLILICAVLAVSFMVLSLCNVLATKRRCRYAARIQLRDFHDNQPTGAQDDGVEMTTDIVTDRDLLLSVDSSEDDLLTIPGNGRPGGHGNLQIRYPPDNDMAEIQLN